MRKNYDPNILYEKYFNNKYYFNLFYILDIKINYHQVLLLKMS